MTRIVFHFLAGISLLLSVAFVALWVRSRFRTDIIEGDCVDQQNKLLSDYLVQSKAGYIEIKRNRAYFDQISPLMIQQPRHFGSYEPETGEAPPLGLKITVTSETEIEVFITQRGWMRMTDAFRSGKSWSILSSEYLYGRSVHVLIADWFAAMATAIMPMLWIWQKMRRRRQRRIGLCQSCGYDLRVTPGRCPECGRVPRVRAGKNEQRISSV